MNLANIINNVINEIINMKDGNSSTIRDLIKVNLTIPELFEVQEAVVKELKKHNIMLDYSKHDGKFEGLPFNLEFVKRTNLSRNKMMKKNSDDTIWVFKDEEDKIIKMNVIGEYEYLGGLDTIDLIVGKIYKRVEDQNDFRIVDESGEDYIYPEIYFKRKN